MYSMRKGHLAACLAVGLSLGLSGAASAAIVGPYVADGNTLMLYHFDEASGASDPGNPIVNHGTEGAAYNLTSTGGPDGRDNIGGGGYGATAYAGFGSAFDVFASGDGTYHASATATGGGLNTSHGSPVQADFQGASGAFTYEAMIKLDNITTEHWYINRDNSTATRGFLLGNFANGNLVFGGGAGSGSVQAAIPTTGPNAFVAGEWFHVAVTYDGNGGVAGNVKLYWTRVDPSATEANLLASGTLAADAANATTELYVGAFGRSPYRFEIPMIDEVRISSVARGADEFIFAIPPPAALPAGLALMGLIASRRR